MIEVRTFEGDAGEAVRFLGRVWKRAYAGREMFPVWSEGFLRWQLFSGPDEPRDLLLAAYSGGRLAATLFAHPALFRLGDEVFPGALGSWLAVDDDLTRSGVGIQLVAELERRTAERGLALTVGYALGGVNNQAVRFWQTAARAFPRSVRWNGWLGFWSRPLDHAAVTAWSYHLHERLGVGLLSLVQRGVYSSLTPGSKPPVLHPPPAGSGAVGVRPFSPDDQGRCVELLRGLTADGRFGLVPGPEGLTGPLTCPGVAETLVAVRGGRVDGVLAYHLLECEARTSLLTAIVDAVAFDGLGGSERRALWGAALQHMADRGAKLALMLQLPAWSARSMLSAGFVPTPPEVGLVLVRGSRPLPPVRPAFLVLR